jgi:hemophore-related protein
VYFAAHPDVNQALIDAARQPAFIAVGQFDDYFEEHPDEADALRGIQAPLGAFKDRCGLQVAPTDALAVLAEV